MLGMLIPNIFFQMQLRHKLASLSDRKDKDYILYRVNYYNKLLPGAILPESVPALAEHKLKGTKSISMIPAAIPAGFPNNYG